MLHGQAAEPTCVVIADGGDRMEAAGDVWGLETGPATDRLQDSYGSAAAVAVIGPAGERGVPYASIVTCRHHPLPRLGLGAVLGGKMVKAVVCVGSARPPVADTAARCWTAPSSRPRRPIWPAAPAAAGIWKRAST